MTQYASRSMRVLPLLEARRGALETCVFCPKLCRTTCPVSNAEPRETLIPWGKMTTAWMTAHGDMPADRAHAAPAWACTGCLACSAACEHRNPVADVLADARDALAKAGVAPEGALRALARFERHADRTRSAALRLASAARLQESARTALFIGCTYLRGAPREARDAVDVAASLTGEPISLLTECCGLPLRLAGDRKGFERHARRVAAGLAERARIFVLDPGCAVTLTRRYRQEVGVDLRRRVVLLVEAAALALPSLGRIDRPDGAPVRWHDPCQLGRGLGVYDAPRAVLTRALGRAPDELPDTREQAPCSGAGGLLPWTMPEISRRIADARLEAHARGGGGRIVTGCASSLIALRRRAAGSGVAVDDLVTWMARALRAGRTTSSPRP